MAKKEFNIDQGFEQLDQIIEKLGSDEIKLSDAVKLYSEGVTVVKKCKDSLDKVEKELIILDENGEEHEL
ncbi:MULTISPECIES: exodeoxyribonuclease VII small subunit [Anaerostipes]|uniref:exodeoxyribonuclease VII small subunit n=1 Tax=Anaerostipes TaxID=207244 RepID=UPI0009526E1C|nr:MULTISPECIES: exodeoxyribonuclease VII small subunit [Anaerostipes]MCI5623262.1 exodeoxyribonuclease VII small subunit [Anaerostipes sp.]MDY2726561.1 exodeoxyribonuclease VII small subunit [Anaerostipes faecalis]OLR58604.1 exodeoxyribonuclease VII small subunit [Anaerostipes sp. 494a]